MAGAENLGRRGTDAWAGQTQDQIWYPRRDSNPRHRLRRPVLYPLSYGGNRASIAEIWASTASAQIRLRAVTTTKTAGKALDTLKTP